ncbi:DUF1850 domain-containing protein [Sporosarcina sp. ANT_H38]|uniref:DUF1850 domain-containing protein n=1 Tax=Sporosarcina sp. ANT_H38 TaxID=2597358 RepID=UPI0011F301DC|nr:DUF1850 domain-containing protein [Sporosarcina sp. ANT_H38]KAA0966703.1 DUF1850 domain-containing protein [Sporosarcina sp. ANT_H38]
MKLKIAAPLIFFFICTVLFAFFIPAKWVFTFIEHRVESPKVYYLPLKEDNKFQIRYVHSIHLTDVIESYEVTANQKIRLLSMQYENLAIGLPGYAEEGETFAVQDGVYTLTYEDNVIDSYVMLIGDVDAALDFRYLGKELDLKKQLVRGKSYTFCVQKLSFYQMLKGVNMNGKRNKAQS